MQNIFQNIILLSRFPVEMEEKRMGELKGRPWIFVVSSFYAVPIKGAYNLRFIQI